MLIARDALAKRKAVLLINLGSPQSPQPDDVRRYLSEFLMDKYVINKPFLLRWLLVEGLIIPKRFRDSAKAYQEIWTEDGSPLIHISRQLRDLVQQKIDFPVGLAMRYGQPSIKRAIDDLVTQSKGKLQDLLIVPLYPHYAESSYETARAEVARVIGKHYPAIKTQSLPPFYEEPRYIRAVADMLADQRRKQDYDIVLFSYHGLPESHLRRADPTGMTCLANAYCCEGEKHVHRTCYRAQAYKTTAAIAEACQLASTQLRTSFQSRLGREPWLQPFTDEEVVKLAGDGVTRLLVLCPSFVADCLETLEEIGMRLKDDFIAAGGLQLDLLPCLNTSPAWVDALSSYCDEGLTGKQMLWPVPR